SVRLAGPDRGVPEVVVAMRANDGLGVHDTAAPGAKCHRIALRRRTTRLCGVAGAWMPQSLECRDGPQRPLELSCSAPFPRRFQGDGALPALARLCLSRKA